jgi:hypothetical protein
MDERQLTANPMCYAGYIHSLFPKREFRVAIARLYTEYPLAGEKLPVCRDHLNSYLDYADDHPEIEPVKIEWL